MPNPSVKKILITGANGMLAHDFIDSFSHEFRLFLFDKNGLDIRSISQLESNIIEGKPDLVLNFAAYTAVDDAEDTGMKSNYDINTLGTYNLAKITKKYNIDLITISTDYVFNGKNENGYMEGDSCNPINQYGISKYLGEKLAKQENNNSIIIRTSWLYGGGKKFKNFVNTMIKLSENHNELKIINDQFGNPTYTVDISNAISQVIHNISEHRGEIFHFSNASNEDVAWSDFAKEIFKLTGKDIRIIECDSEEYKTKAKRPKFSKLINNSDILLRDWREGLADYLNKLKKDEK